MHRNILSVLLTITAVSASACATERLDGFKLPSSPLTLNEAKPLIEAGLCKTGAEYLEQSGCEEWKAFLAGGKPSLPAKAFAVGPVFRVELTKSHQVLWSEKNSIYVLYNSGDADDLKSIRFFEVNSDNATEEREVEKYLLSIFKGMRDKKSPFHTYLESHVVRPHRIYTFTSRGDNGFMTYVGQKDIAYLRQKGKKIYLFISSIHSNAYEYDQHPVLYLAVLAAPD